MKLKNVMEIYQILKGMKLNQFEDKDTRKNLILLYMNLGSEVKKFETKQEELKTTYFADKQEEIRELTELEQKIRVEPDVETRKALIAEQMSHIKTYELINEFNTVVSGLLDEEKEIVFTPINRENFVEGLMDNVTFEQIDILTPIFE